jgi:penicillin amidase
MIKRLDASSISRLALSVGPAIALAILLSTPTLAQPPSQLPGLQNPAVIGRDVDGMAHINAKSSHDVYFLQGWVHAQDRLFQMDLNRRQASGTLAELLGPAVLDSDVELRTLGLRRAAEASLPVLSQRTRDAIQAYTDGVNAWVSSHPLPLEYQALEITSFEPWVPVDSVVIGKVIAFSLSFDLDIGLTQTLVAYQTAGETAGFDGTALFFEDLFRSAPFDPASTLPDAGVAPPALFPPSVTGSQSGIDLRSMTEAARVGLRRLQPATLELAADYLDRVKDLPLLRGAIAPRERIQGSNEFVVAGRFTADGRAILANDPHLALNTPSTFYQIHLRVPQERLDVIGSGFPGVPFVILGQNDRIAWGATTNPLDVTDTFQEELVIDPDSGFPVATVYGGQAELLVPVPQVFRFNQPGDGEADNLATAPAGGTVDGTFIPPAVLLVPRRNNGPLIEVDPEAGVGLSIQYTGFGPTKEVEAFRIWNRARNLNDFMEGLRHFDVGSQNWAYADVFGNIAYFTSAEMPVREDLQAGTVDGLPPFLIRDGTGGNEWLPVQNLQPEQSLPYEILPFEEMPHLINPPAGFFVNANNDPAGTTLDNNPLNQLRPGGGIYYLNPGYASGFRAGRITRSLHEKFADRPVTPEDVKDVQAEVRLLDAEVLTPYLVSAFDRAAAAPFGDPQLAALVAQPRIGEAISRLRNWDYSFPTGIPEGYDHTDVDGMLSPPSADEVAASVAATLYSVWRGQVIRRTLDAALEPLGLPVPGSDQAMTALRHLLDTFPQTQGIGASGLEFFPAPGAVSRDAARDIALLGALSDALDLLAGDAFDRAFGGSTDQDDYRWGRLHRIVLEHPLGPPFSIPPAGGAFPPPLPGLDGIPVDGGFGAVDASSHSARADSTDEFMFGSGPVRRYVGQPGTGESGPDKFFTAETSLPGGASGVLTSPFFANLLPRWLTNDTYPLRQGFLQYEPAVVERHRFVPAP